MILLNIIVEKFDTIRCYETYAYKMDNLKSELDAMSKRMSSYEIKVMGLEWTVTYLRDVIRSMNIDTLLPQALGKVLGELIDGSICNEVFRISDEFDYDSTLKILADTKTVLNWGQYLEVCILLDDVDDKANKGDNLCEQGKKIFQKIHGMDIKEFRVTEWIEAIQKLISYIESLPNKGEIPQQNVVKHKSSVTTLSPSNLIQEAIKFHKSNNSASNDLSETIQEMLLSKTFLLCETLLANKLNFVEANAYFLSAIAPHSLHKKDIMAILFK